MGNTQGVEGQHQAGQEEPAQHEEGVAGSDEGGEAVLLGDEATVGARCDGNAGGVEAGSAGSRRSAVGT